MELAKKKQKSYTECPEMKTSGYYCLRRLYSVSSWKKGKYYLQFFTFILKQYISTESKHSYETMETTTKLSNC
jgi:hypothetical protein